MGLRGFLLANAQASIFCTLPKSVTMPTLDCRAIRWYWP